MMDDFVESENYAADFKNNAKHASKDDDLRQALEYASYGFRGKRDKAIAAINMNADSDEFATLRDQGKAIKNHCLDHLDIYLQEYEQAVLKQGGNVHWAQSGADVCKIVLDICREKNAKTVTKGKSMVSEEVNLNHHLERAGIKTLETDLGEYIIQQRGERPSHIIAPALHIQKKDVEKTFRQHHNHLPKNRDLQDREALVNEARIMLRKEYGKADIGITGANFLVAESGSAIIVTNEGNGDMTQLCAKTHIVITSIEKIVPRLEDAAALLRLLARSATGQAFSTYTTISSGAKRDGDLDGPEDYHVILLDNGRSDILQSDNRDVLRCIKCGACMNHCPIYQAIGGHAYGWVYPGPIGSVLTPHMTNLKKTHDLPNASSFCGRCEEVCPVRIPLPSLLRNHRNRVFQRKLDGFIGHNALIAWNMLISRPKFYHFVINMIALFLSHAGKVRDGYFKKLPLASGWCQYRHMPAPSGQSFMAQYKKLKQKQNDQ